MRHKHDLVKFLISHESVNCGLRTRDGSHGLELAAEDPTMLRLLLDSKTKTEPNDLDENGHTALHCAVENSDYNRVQMLLTYARVDPNIYAGRKARTVQGA